MRKYFIWLLAAIVMFANDSFASSCGVAGFNNVCDSIVEICLKNMSLREKVGQMFFVRPEALDTAFHWSSYAELKEHALQEVTDSMRHVNERYPIGGIVLFAHNIKDPSQLKELIRNIRDLNGSPALCIDEEGGRVVRIACNPNFKVPKYESMQVIAESGDPNKAYDCGASIGGYLHKYGFDIDFAPVSDVNTNPDNPIIGTRAFGNDPELAAKMAVGYLQGLKDNHIIGCMKHFPGHGDTKTDTHYGYAETQKTWEEMLNCEMTTFKAGIAWGVRLIMTAHISAPGIDGSGIPSTMSKIILQDKLRMELGYNNVIITDALDMGAITKQYSDQAAAVGTIKAGVDILLCPKDFVASFDAVVNAVECGEISEERIDSSVRKILMLKMIR